ncbi:hypothetical protein QOZ80_6AG0517790 [Eleusine coracana subsp. coracana]|nr:hypothetical protein QOZ80_6AG0517790 [Eleusine coracana subsp. coracana]
MTAHAGACRQNEKAAYLMRLARAGAGHGVVHRQNQNPKAAAASAASGDLVRQTCANATTAFCRLQVTEETCVSELRSDNRSAQAKDVRDLTFLAIDLVKLSAAAADAKIASMLKEKMDKDTELSLRMCRINYDTMARLVPECHAVAELYNSADPGAWGAHRYFDCIRRLMVAARDSESAVYDLEAEHASVMAALKKEVDQVVQRTLLVNAVNEQMVGWGYLSADEGDPWN